MAAAVVTDVGGPLSHGSTVAREYDIPAVLGTGVATRRIRSGQRIHVDGDAGTVTLMDGMDEVGTGRSVAEAAPETRSSPNARTVLRRSGRGRGSWGWCMVEKPEAGCIGWMPLGR